MLSRKISVVVVALLVLSVFFSYGQVGADRTTLLKKLSAMPKDSSRISLLMDICNDYREKDKTLEGALPYALELLQYRQQQGNKVKISATEDFVGQIYLDKKDYPNASDHFIRSTRIKEELKDFGHTYLGLLDNIGLIYYNNDKFAKAGEYYRQLINISKQQGNKSFEAKGELMAGRVYTSQGSWDKAEENLTRSLALSRQRNSKADVAVALNGLGVLFCRKDDFVKGLDYYFQSLKLGEELNDPALVAFNLNDITVALQSNRDYDAALKYLSAAQTTYGSSDMIMAALLGNIGTIYLSQGRLVPAINTINSSLKLADKISDNTIAANGLCNLGIIHIMQKEYPAALIALRQSLSYSMYRKDEIMIARNFISLGRLYLDMSNDSVKTKLPDSLRNQPSGILLKRAGLYLNNAIAICKRLGKKSLLQEAYRLLSEVQHYQQDNKSATDTYGQYILTRDSIFSIDNAKQLNKLEMKYQFDKQVAEKEKEAELSKAAAAYKLKLYSIIAIAIFLLGLLAFILYRRIVKGRYDLQIVSLRQEAINAQMSDHFIGNTMHSINQFIRDNDKDKASEYLERFSRLIRNVMEHSTNKMVPLEDDLAVLKDYIELTALRFPADGLQYSIGIDKNIDTLNVLVPPMVLQILAENAIVHGFKKTKSGYLQISIHKKDTVLEFVVEDNGMGRAAATAEKQQEGTVRRSVGGSLAEKLVKLAGRYRNTVNFTITDIVDAAQKPAGTKVVFTIPYTIVD